MEKYWGEGDILGVCEESYFVSIICYNSQPLVKAGCIIKLQEVILEIDCEAM